MLELGSYGNAVIVSPHGGGRIYLDLYFKVGVGLEEQVAAALRREFVFLGEPSDDSEEASLRLPIEADNGAIVIGTDRFELFTTAGATQAAHVFHRAMHDVVG